MDTVAAKPAVFEDRIAALRPRECLLACEIAEGIVGWGSVARYSPRPGYSVACETSVYLARAAQGRGLGSKLEEALLARAHAAGYRHLVAKVMAANEASVRFHQRHGYEVVGRQRDVGYLDGAWQDVVILQRVFDDVPPP
jgi:phosphinothricin acetyltransferase